MCRSLERRNHAIDLAPETYSIASVSAQPTSGTNTAAGPAAGYFYQLRFALLKALQLHPKFPTGTISIELADDVSFTHDQVTVDHQLKHSIKPGATMTVSSPAFWRTLAIWLDQLQDPTLSTREFHLVSTSEIPRDDPLKKFAANTDSDEKSGALELLKIAAAGSKNKSSQADRELFLSFEDSTLLLLLRRMTIFENASDLGNLAIDLDEALHWAAGDGQAANLREDLEGWWISRIFKEWKDRKGAIVVLEEVATRVHFLRQRHDESKLTFDIEAPDCTEILEDKNFVRQIRLVTDRTDRIRRAQKAFLMAQAARSKWVREFSIDPEELAQYDDGLFERWEAHLIGVVDEIENAADAQAVIIAGKKILHWAETSEVQLRNLRNIFLTSGSYQVLADTMRLGWHPNFESELSK